MATNTVERWVAVEGYEGYYEISDMGRIRSLDRYSGGRFFKGQMLTPVMNNKGYLQVLLCKDGESKRLLLHRLVAAAFCEHPEGCDIVNHKDCNPSNCEATNLEFVTHKENTLHAIMENRMVTVAVLRSDGTYYPILARVKEDGFNPSAVVACCNGRQNTHRGYGWNYAAFMEGGPVGRVRRFRMVPESCGIPCGNENQNIQSKKDVKKLNNQANQTRLPKIGMQAVFVPTIHWSADKKEPTPPARGRVVYINYRHQIFTVEYRVRLGVLRENFKFVDIGSQVRLYPA